VMLASELTECQQQNGSEVESHGAELFLLFYFFFHFFLGF